MSQVSVRSRNEENVNRGRNEGRLIAIIICTLFAEAMEREIYVGRELAIYTGLTAFLWVPVILLLGALTGNNVHHHVNIMFCFVLAVFALAGAIFLIWKAMVTDDGTKRVIAIIASITGTLNSLLLIFEILTNVIFEIALKAASNRRIEFDLGY